MPKGPARAAARRLLSGLGLRTASASNPFEAAARFAEVLPALVIASAAAWRRHDLALLTAIRARSRDTAVVLLVPPERRALAGPAIEAGADAWLPEPVDLRELRALSARLLRRVAAAGAAPGAGGPALKRLAAEVGHSVNNPLQVLRLLLEEGPSPARPSWKDDVGREAGRIRDAVDIVAAYGRLSEPRKSPLSLGAVLAESLEAEERSGRIRRVGPPPNAGVSVSADPDMAKAALDALVRFAVGRSEAKPALVRGIARRFSARGHVFAEAAIRARGVHVPPVEWDEHVGSVVWTDERNRLPFPGLALPAAVATAHGGSVVRRDTPPGTVLAIRFPSG